MDLAGFDRHSGLPTHETPMTKFHRTTQNVRRFPPAQFGAEIHPDRPSMVWIRSGAPKTMGDINGALDRRRPGKMAIEEA